MKSKMNHLFVGLLITLGSIQHACSGCERNQPEEKNSTTEDSLVIQEQSVVETYKDVEIPEEVKKENLEREKKRQEIIEEELNSSSYKDMKDDEIQSLLEKKLKDYSSSCEQSEFDDIVDLLRNDARFKKFKDDQYRFIKDYQKHLVEAKKNCGSNS